jgi:MFS family permease
VWPSPPSGLAPGSSGLSESSRSSALRLVMAAALVDYLGVGMMRTLIPFYAKRLVSTAGGASGGSVGVVSTATLLGQLESAYGVGQLCGASVMGWVSDVAGRRTVLLITFLGSALGYTVAGLAGSPAMLLYSRLPVGVAKQTVTVARAVIADCSEAGVARSVWMARLTAACGVGYSIGPVAGSWLAEESGSDVLPAFVTAAIFCVLFVVVLLYLPETGESTSVHVSRAPACEVVVERVGLSSRLARRVHGPVTRRPSTSLRWRRRRRRRRGGGDAGAVGILALRAAAQRGGRIR